MPLRPRLQAGLTLSVYTETTLTMLITPLRLGSERLLFSPKQTFTDSHLDSVRMSAFGQKQSFAYSGKPCILTVNERLLSARSGHSESRISDHLTVRFRESGLSNSI